MIHVQNFANSRNLWTRLPPVDIAVSVVYKKHNLSHQSQLGRDVELQSRHIVLFKSPRDLYQVGTLGVQLGLASTLVDWFYDATSVPFGHLWIDLSPRADDHIRYCTNSGNIRSKFFVQESLKRSNIWTMNTLNLFSLQAF